MGGAAPKPAPPRATLIAGPNGAGKTTFALEFLPAEARCPTFLIADLITEGPPVAPPRSRGDTSSHSCSGAMDGSFMS